MSSKSLTKPKASLISSDDNLEYFINGGPSIVRTNQYGGIVQEYGWASLQIKTFRDYAIVSIVCNDKSLGIIDDTIHTFIANIKVDSGLSILATIQTQLVRGFNVMIPKTNCASLTKFKDACTQFFQSLE